MIAAPAESTVTISEIETELPIETEIPRTETSKEITEVKLLTPSQNDSKLDEENPFTAFSPVTESG